MYKKFLVPLLSLLGILYTGLFFSALAASTPIPSSIPNIKISTKIPTKSLDDFASKIQKLEQQAGKAYVEQQYAKAQELYTQLAEIITQNLGFAAPERFKALRNRAKSVCGTGHYGEAEESLRSLLQLSSEALGAQHEESLKTQYALAQTLFARTKFKDALDILLPLYRQQISLLGTEHKDAYYTLLSLIHAYYLLGDFEKVQQPLHRVITMAPKLFGDAHEITLQGQWLQALVLDALGEYSQALGILSDTMKKAFTSLGTKHVLTFELFSALATVYTHTGEQEKAIKQYENLVKRKKSLFSENHPEMLKSRRDLAFNSKNKDNLQEVARKLTAIVEEQKKILDEDHLDTLLSIKSLAVVYMAQHSFPQASGLLRILLKKAPLFGEHSPLVLSAYADIAHAFFIHGKLSSAQRIYKQLLQKQEKAFGKDSKATLNTAKIIADLEKNAASKIVVEKKVPPALLKEKNDATALINSGEITRALISFEHIYKQYIDLFGKDDVESLRVAHSLATLYENAGELDSAEKLLEEILPKFSQLFGDNHTDTLTIRYSLQLIRSDQGYHKNTVAESKAIYEQLQSTHGMKNIDTFAQGINLAAAYNQVKDYGSAISLLQKNIPLGQQYFGSKHKLVLMAQILLSSTYNKNGDTDTALALLNNILNTVSTDHILKRQFYIYLYKMYAHIFAQKGKKEESIRFYFKALFEENKNNGKYHLTFLELLRDVTQIMSTMEKERERAFQYTNIGIVRSLMQRVPSDTIFQTFFDNLKNISLALGHQETAIYYSKMSILASRAQRQRNVGLEREYQQTYLNSQLFIYHEAIHLLAQAKRQQEAFTVLNLLKESELDDSGYQKIAKEDNIQQFFTPSEAAIYEEFLHFAKQFKTLGDQLIHLHRRKDYLTTQEQNTLEMLYAQEKVLRDELLIFFKSIQARLTQDKFTKKYAFGSKNVRLLQSILKITPKSVFIHTVNTSHGLYIFLTSSKKFLMRYVPIASQDIHHIVTQLRARLSSPYQDPKPVAEKLYKILISPLEETLHSLQPQTLAFSLDGALRYVPMSTLYNNNQWLIEKYNIVMFTDAAREALLKQNSKKKHIAAMGITKSFQGFSALPAVKHEINGIVKHGNMGILQGTKYIDAEFTQQALQKTLQQKTPLIHVASHFQFDANEQKNSFLLLGDGKKLSMGTMFASKSPFSFTHVDLLTLSACDTASGLQKGDGREIESFGALAQKRGAGAVLATLWPVADASTATFMQEFYSQLGLKGHSKAAALANTQRLFLQKANKLHKQSSTRGRLLTITPSKNISANSQKLSWSHPYFWAPFILMGNWR